jgi:hypothetical protein
MIPMKPERRVKPLLKQAIRHQNNQSWRWLIMFGSLLLLAIAFAQVIMLLPMPITTFQEDLADHIVLTAISCIFCLVGIIIFLRISTLLTASMAYGVFLCASLINHRLSAGGEFRE